MKKSAKRRLNKLAIYKINYRKNNQTIKSNKERRCFQNNNTKTSKVLVKYNKKAINNIDSDNNLKEMKKLSRKVKQLTK